MTFASPSPIGEELQQLLRYTERTVADRQEGIVTIDAVRNSLERGSWRGEPVIPTQQLEPTWHENLSDELFSAVHGARLIANLEGRPFATIDDLMLAASGEIAFDEIETILPGAKSAVAAAIASLPGRTRARLDENPSAVNVLEIMVTKAMIAGDRTAADSIAQRALVAMMGDSLDGTPRDSRVARDVLRVAEALGLIEQ
jgi:hypothetical protein